jgi:DNA-binding helix-hairpin-helix protein with protein kinase domain
MPFVTEQGEVIALGKLLAESDHVATYELTDGRRIARLFAQSLSERQARKLAVMLEIARPEWKRFAAWPTALLRLAKEEGLRGYLTEKRADAEPLPHLQSPAHRRVVFPSADWKFLVRAARNCAAVVEELHNAGMVIGDVPSGRFLVGSDAEITILGCDSFQFRHGEELFYSTAPVPEYLAPELQSTPLESFPLTPNHDAFGLAVIVFRLLMMGRHPFAGYRGPNQLTIGEAIREFRYAYGPAASSLLMETAPGGLLLSDLPAQVVQSFQRAFSRGSEREGARPTAAEWKKLLDDLHQQCTVCGVDPGHVYFAKAKQCPWCRIEQERGPRFFDRVTLDAFEQTPDAPNSEPLLIKLDCLKSPDDIFQERKEAPLLPAATPAPLPHSIRTFQHVVTAIGILAVAAALTMLLGFFSPNFLYISATLTVCLAVGWAVGFFGSPLRRLRRERRRQLELRRAELRQVEQEMAAVVASFNTEWMPRFKSAALAREQLEAIETQEGADMRRLQATLRQKQLDDYLAHFFLSEAKMQQLTPSRLVALESFHVETARDISERAIAAVPGLGKTLPSTLLAWRRTAESGFSYDSRRGPPPEDLASIRSKYLNQRIALHDQLEVDCETLQRISAAARSKVEQFTVPLAARQSAVVQAEAELKACR